ncbi:MAG TPA: glycoside hydrolase family 2 protein [Kofleriaceae bacterium]|nr:glycoside hydrolase family 2 protein [Kofleriaceae bacterium]
MREVAGERRVALDTGWQLAMTPAGAVAEPRGLGEQRWIAARVPGTAASALRDAGQWSWDAPLALDAMDWWWRRALDDVAGDTLRFGGVATLWDAWIDGEWVAHGDSMFAPRDIDLPAGARELVLVCRALEPELGKKRPRPRWRVPMIAHQQLRWLRTTLLGRLPGWSPPCPPVGPWRPIEAVRHGALRVGAISLDARLEAGTGFVTIGAQLAGEVERATLVIARGDEVMRHELALEAGAWTGCAAVMDPARWWPHTHGEPARYRLAIEARAAGQPHAIDLGATGFRTIALERGDDGRDHELRINGVPVFCRGACWTPLDVVSLGAPAEAYDAAVAQLAAGGMNMLRIGGTMVYEDDALYDALDARGVLLWHDLMFANMDYPDDAELGRAIALEVDHQLARMQARPALAIVCGNSEAAQQAAMSGAPRERWTPALFHEVIPAIVRRRLPGTAYVPSSTHGGAFPHDPSAGATSYYGVGAYLRPLDDARRSGVRFASECLAFANIPRDPALPRAHTAAWKARSPRDLGAGWDFDDVRDHYTRVVFGVDPGELRALDHERYLELGRVATGEVMARTFAEWRRAGSRCRGGLVWLLRDLWPGAGWGVIDAHGAAKPCWYVLRRALQPIALAIADEGGAGLVVHVANDPGAPLGARLELALYRGDGVEVGRGAHDVAVPAHGALALPAADLFDGWMDLSHAYRFGPPIAELVHATLSREGERLAEAFWLPGGLGASRERDLGLTARARARGDGFELVVAAARFAQFVAIDAPGFAADDDCFHLAPGGSRTIALRRAGATGPLRGRVAATNGEAAVRFEAV